MFYHSIKEANEHTKEMAAAFKYPVRVKRFSFYCVKTSDPGGVILVMHPVEGLHPQEILAHLSWHPVNATTLMNRHKPHAQ